jgi:hypothetical protein
MRVAVVGLLMLASPALAQNSPPAEGPMTCLSPVAATDSAKSLMQRYGQEAVIQDDLYTGVEDITYKGLVLLPHDPDWRIEIFFDDETMSRVARLTLHDSKMSHWNVAGITLGSSLAEVQKVNGRPFLLNGWDSDFAGFVASWKGGKLSKPSPGDCVVELRFGKDQNEPKEALAQRVSSDNAALVKWAPVVTQIELRFLDR